MADEQPEKPYDLALFLKRSGNLKGGDNSHHKAKAFHIVDEQGKRIPKKVSAFDFEDLGHKERDFGTTNVGDIRASTRATVCVGETYPGKHIVTNSKHTRPVIIARGDSQLEATVKAIAADVNSPFGGVWSLSHPLEYETAVFLNRVFAEAFITPKFDDGTAELLRDTDKNNNPHNKPEHKNRFLLQTGKLTRSDIEYLSMQVMGVDVIEQELI